MAPVWDVIEVATEFRNMGRDSDDYCICGWICLFRDLKFPESEDDKRECRIT